MHKLYQTTMSRRPGHALCRRIADESHNPRRRRWHPGPADGRLGVSCSTCAVPGCHRAGRRPSGRQFRGVGAVLFRRRDRQTGAESVTAAPSAGKWRPESDAELTGRRAAGAPRRGTAGGRGTTWRGPPRSPAERLPAARPHSAPVSRSRRRHIPAPRPANRRPEGVWARWRVRRRVALCSATRFAAFGAGAQPRWIGRLARETFQWAPVSWSRRQHVPAPSA